MKCYINEINRLTQENMNVKETIDILEREKDMLLRERDNKRNSMKLYEMMSDTEYKTIRNRLCIIDRGVSTLNEQLRINNNMISHLRSAYQKLHTCDYYNPMDEIDIQESILNKGYIIGIKL